MNEPDRRRHRVRGLIAHLTWWLHRGWTEKDEWAYVWEVKFAGRTR